VNKKPNNHIHLTVKRVTFFARQKNRRFLRQVMWTLEVLSLFDIVFLRNEQTLMAVSLTWLGFYFPMQQGNDKSCSLRSSVRKKSQNQKATSFSFAACHRKGWVIFLGSVRR
jgi:hypothetical protein